MSRRILGLAVAVVLAAPAAHAITREEVMVRARSFAFHPWQSSTANMTASCKPGYQSLYIPGDQLGVAYDWGGYMTLKEFDLQIAAGLGAGSQEPDGVLACTVGLDCSGFVSQAWMIGHHTTSNLDQVSTQVTVSSLLAGDVFNQAGYHVALFDKLLASGEPAMIEALGYNVHQNVTGGFSHVNGYLPRRSTTVTGTTAGNPTGTATNPIVVGALPFTDQRDTRQSPSRMFDACGLAPNSNESGPEYVYAVTVAQPGQLTVSVSDDATTDIDVELFTQLNTNACIARHNSSFTQDVGCGTYYVVADTFGTASGPYTLNITLAPSGQACSGGPPAFSPKGAPGDACAYPGNAALPYCNPNLGGDTCIYSGTDSFCSKPCKVDADCGEMPGGGCCKDVGGNGPELYCMTKGYCSGGNGGGGDAGGGKGGGKDSGGGGGGGNGGWDGGSGPGEGEGQPNASNPSTVTTSSGCTAARGNEFAGPWIVLGIAAITGRGRWRRTRPR